MPCRSWSWSWSWNFHMSSRSDQIQILAPIKLTQPINQTQPILLLFQCSPMRPPSSEDEDEGPLISSISVTSAKTSGRLSDASTLSSSSIWDQLSDWEPFLDQMDHGAQPTCVPPLYDSRKADPSIKDKRKFYNVYSGDLIGCYREWYVGYSIPSLFLSALLSQE